MYKLIGTFSEIDGIETKTMKEMVDRFKLIGSLSDDVGSIKIFYTENEPIVYAIAENSETCYGKKEEHTNEELLNYAMKLFGINKKELEEKYKNDTKQEVH